MFYKTSIIEIILKKFKKTTKMLKYIEVFLRITIEIEVSKKIVQFILLF